MEHQPLSSNMVGGFMTIPVGKPWKTSEKWSFNGVLWWIYGSLWDLPSGKLHNRTMEKNIMLNKQAQYNFGMFKNYVKLPKDSWLVVWNMLDELP